MTYLLDTHFLIWAIADTGKIPTQIKSIITNTDNRIVVSTISFWEISLKYSIGKLSLTGIKPEDFPEICKQIGFEIEPVSAEISSTYHHLKATYHRDPFDRMLIWQAIKCDYIFMSIDSEVKKYESEGLKIYNKS